MGVSWTGFVHCLWISSIRSAKAQKKLREILVNVLDLINLYKKTLFHTRLWIQSQLFIQQIFIVTCTNHYLDATEDFQDE